jgi:hypothetical protein
MVLFRICTNITKKYIWVVYGAGRHTGENRDTRSGKHGKRKNGGGFYLSDPFHIWLGWKAEARKEAEGSKT